MSHHPGPPNTIKEYRYLFGPVPSRRLGVSLGLDLAPPKTCTLDCLYCEVGRTTNKTVDRFNFRQSEDILSELADFLSRSAQKLDYVTLAGSGEPTLNTQLPLVVEGIRKLTPAPVALLTNGSLFFRDEVRAAVRDIDLIIPSLDCVDESSFQAVNRPHPSLRLPRIIEGLKTLRREHAGPIWLEVLLVKGLNDQPAHLERLRRVLNDLRPDRIQLNTVVRPPAYPKAAPLSPEELESIREYLGEKAEVVASFSRHHMQSPVVGTESRILDLLSRRPCPYDEIRSSTGLADPDITSILQRLVEERRIRCEMHEGKKFYLAA